MTRRSHLILIRAKKQLSTYEQNDVKPMLKSHTVLLVYCILARWAHADLPLVLFTACSSSASICTALPAEGSSVSGQFLD